MKKPYQKPEISVEVLSLDRPIAVNCNADYDDMLALMEFGYFSPNDRGITCGINTETMEWGNDTICYHSNVRTAFLS